VEPALGLVEAWPAASALIATLGSNLGADRAADRAIAFVVQGVVGKPVGAEVFPDLLACPVGERIKLPDGRAISPARVREDGYVDSTGRWLAPEAGDPKVERAQAPPEGLDFTKVTALVRVTLPEAVAMLAGLLLEGEFREGRLHHDAKLVLESGLEVDGLAEEQASI
jgi:hypothetical protein